MAGYRSKRLMAESRHNEQLHSKPVGSVLDRLVRGNDFNLSFHDGGSFSKGNEAMTDTENNTQTRDVFLHIFDRDVKAAAAFYLEAAEKQGKDGSNACAAIVSVLSALACQMGSIILTKDGFLEVVKFAWDKHEEHERQNTRH